MGNLQSPTPKQLLTEAIIFWTIGLLLLICRMVSRTLGIGLKGLKPDDFVLLVTFCFWTSLMILINISASYATNLFEPDQLAGILADPKDVSDRIYGSKIVIGLEQCMLFSTWGVKAVLLTMWYHLTKKTFQDIFVKVVAGYVVLGLFVIEITYFAVWCRPFSQYWAVPVENPQCATYQRYSITQAVFNITSDIMILLIPVPVILGSSLPLKRKLTLMPVFTLGLFVVLAAVLNKYYNFSNPQTTIYMIWYIRESSTAIYVACLLTIWPLLRKLFKLRTFSDSDTDPMVASPTTPDFPRKMSWRHRMAGNVSNMNASAALNTTASMEAYLNMQSATKENEKTDALKSQTRDIESNYIMKDSSEDSNKSWESQATAHRV